MRRLYIANFFTPERFFRRVGGDKWTVNVSRFMFFGYQRVRGMICWIAEKSIDRRVMIFWPPAVENTPAAGPAVGPAVENEAQIEQIEAEWSCQKPSIIVCTAPLRRRPFRRRPSLYGALP